MITLSQIFKRQQKNEIKDFGKRARDFHAKYKILVEESKCDFKAFLTPCDDGEKVKATLSVIDASDEANKDKDELIE